MSQQQALRLAQLHNREDSFHHDLTTTDKVRTWIQDYNINYAPSGKELKLVLYAPVQNEVAER